MHLFNQAVGRVSKEGQACGFTFFTVKFSQPLRPVGAAKQAVNTLRI